MLKNGLLKRGFIFILFTIIYQIKSDTTFISNHCNSHMQPVLTEHNIKIGQFRYAYDSHLRDKLMTETIQKKLSSGALYNSCSEKFGNLKNIYQ